ncbi:MAG: putative oxidoreductase [Verrucomicrobiales bacterium]|jgi:uncharacterized membrane protein YphA (DoxX/SURF4 family)
MSKQLPTFLIWAFRVFLAYLFLTASIGGWVWAEGGIVRADGKLADPQRFLSQIRAFQLLHDPWNAWLAMGLPWLELFTGIALLLPWTALGGSAVASGLLGMFIVGLASVQMRGLEVDCGCFGGAGTATDTGIALAWRALWLGMAITCFCALWKRASRQAHTESA